MWKRIKNYFLERFRQKNKAELKKAFYLFLSTLTVLGFFCFLLIAHVIFKPGNLFLLGDFVGIVGCLITLRSFRKGNIETAGKLLVGFIVVVIVLHCVLTDMTKTDPAIRYRLYITFVCILATYFIFISFFRNIRNLIYFTVLFVGILTLHFLVILHQIGTDRQIAFFCLEHYIVVVVGVIVATVISGLLVTMIETLYLRALEQGETISKQNTDLQITIDEQTRFLVSSNESLRELAYLTSHDLREPLRSISGFVSLIKKNSDANTIDQNRKEVNEYFDYVQKGVKQMEELIGDIKEFSSINILEKNFSRINMKELLQQVAETLDAEITRTGSVISIQQEMPDIYGDRTLLQSLFQNLISNAIKYQNTGRVPHITINHEMLEGNHLFIVKDNGIGIPEEYRERIFLAFKRLHGKDSAYEGTGLGLAICKKIVEIHNGEIWLESKVGEGSTFFFTLRSDGLGNMKIG